MSIADLVRACGKAFYGNEPDYETVAIAYAKQAIAAVATHQANGFADSRLHGLTAEAQ